MIIKTEARICDGFTEDQWEDAVRFSLLVLERMLAIQYAAKASCAFDDEFMIIPVIRLSGGRDSDLRWE